MKDTKTKLAFIKARAEGKSYAKICEDLGLSKSTCQSWEQSLKADIEALKEAQTEELYTAYNMKREARIKALGGIIAEIDKAIVSKDFSEVPLEKLLSIRLKYFKELREEYIDPAEAGTDNTLDGLLEQYNQLYRHAQTGKYSPAEIRAQLNILDAKRDTLYKLTEEQTKEEANPFDIDSALKPYNSKLLRHEQEARREA